MQLERKNLFTCQINRHLLVWVSFIICLVLSGKVLSADNNGQLISVSNKAARTPANFIPDDDVEYLPFDQQLWIDRTMVEDSGGVLRNMRDSISAWQETEEYADNWNVESTGLYVLPTMEKRKAYISKQMFKYLDKRLSGEIKQAEEGSTLAKVGEVHKALRPNTQVQISSMIKMKFKARVLQGKAIMLLDNPFMDSETVFTASGKIKTTLHRNFADLGMRMNVEYKITDGVWIASVDKSITNKITARLSSEQNDGTMAFSTDQDADKKLEVIFYHPF